MEKPSVKISLSKHALPNYTITQQSSQTDKHKHTHNHTVPLSVAEFKVTAAAISFHSSIQGPVIPLTEEPWSAPAQASLCGEADAAAFHTDFQAIRGLAAGIHDATVHVTGRAAVVAQVVGAATAAASL